MKKRQEEILKAIVEHFIETANPVGSKYLQTVRRFPFSAATIRNEMHSLEKDGFLESPHTSAGRIPTTFGFRFFVSDLYSGGLESYRPKVKKDFTRAQKEFLKTKKADESIFDTVSILSRLTTNVAFATTPSSKRTFFLGVSRMLGEPEFSTNPEMASQVFKVLEEDFFELLKSLEITPEVQIFIGKENILPEIQSCTLIVSAFKVLGFSGAIGILGPQRMNFARNILALEEALEFLHSHNAQEN
jgi:transcriptional regulator of heat shock response